MRGWKILWGKKDNLVKDLKETTLSFERLGKKYGVSRQAIHGFCKRHGIKRPKRPMGHQTGKCRLCQKLIQISKKPQTEFISIHTIINKMGTSKAKYFHHLRRLRSKGLVSQRFGRLRSRRLEKAYAIYFTTGLPIRTIGREVGIRNLQWLIRRHRALGWNVPTSLYGSDGGKRNRVQSETYRRKQE